MRQTCGIANVTAYPFPEESQSLKAAQWLKALGLDAPRVGFTRYFISLKDYQSLRDAVPGFVVEDLAAACYQLRAVKCGEELLRMREASRILDIGMAAAVKAVGPGLRETEVLAEADYAMRKAGSQGSPFRMQVLCHDRQMLLHPYASDAVLRKNEPVVIHLGASVHGYTAKLCRTVFLGNVQEQSRAIYRCLTQAQQAAAELLRPGITCGAVYDAVTAVVQATPFAPYWEMEQIGYGVGIRQSEFYPVLAKGSKVPLQENMVIDLLLPTLYMPGYGGPRITDTIRITENGAEYLTHFSREELLR
jgi:Xaa-Pro dipeptidase